MERDTNPTHSFDLADVEKYGSIEKALIVKEIRGMQIYKMRHGSEGWVYYSSEALEKKFPYMPNQSIRRWLRELETAGHIESTIQNKVQFDRTKSYRVTEVTPIVQNEQSIAQNERSQRSKMSNDIAQNERTIPSPTTHSSLRRPVGSAFKKPSYRQTPRREQVNVRGRHSPAKERLMAMVDAKRALTN